MPRPLALLALLVVTGCASASVRFDPTPTQAAVTPSEVTRGDALYPFPTPAGRWGYMDAQGGVVLAPAYDSAAPFSEGRAAVQLGDAYGYIDPSGALVVPAQFASASPFADGRAVVTVGPPTKPRYGFVDPMGTLVVPTVLPRAYSFSEGLALVRFLDRDLTLIERVFGTVRPGVTGFIDRSGEVVFSLSGESSSFSEGLAPFSRLAFLSRTRWGYVRPDGSVAVDAEFRGTAFGFTDGLARMGRGDEIGFVDRAGRPAFETTYALANAFSEGRAAVHVDDRWGYIDRAGRLVVPARFTQAGAFSGGLAAVEVGGRWGYVGPDGALVIPPTYHSAQAFRGPLAYVSDETGPHYIDREGRPIYPDIAPF